MSKVKVPASISGLYQSQPTAEAKSNLLKDYKDWQDSRFSKAHYDYLVRENERLLQEYVDSSWINRFMRRNFIAENKAQLALIKKLKATFRCEEI